MARNHLILVDGSSYIFRAYHALPPLTRKSDGLPVGAVSGFCNMLYKLVQDDEFKLDPTHFAVIFDAKGPTFRNDIFDQYKANRPPAPEDLVPQFPVIRDAVRAFNLACIEQSGYEADDIIATLAKQAVSQDFDVTIVSSDKDLMQLIEPGIAMLDTMKSKAIGPDEVFAKFGVSPDKVVDVQALAGDSVDNVPGVPGIGVKTAAQLINDFGDLETLLAEADTIKQKKRRENLIEFAEQARISKQLVYLAQDVPVVETLDQMAMAPLEPAPLLSFLKAMEFSTLTRRVANAFKVDEAAMPAADPALAAASTTGTDASAGDGGAQMTDAQALGLDRAIAAGQAAATALPVSHDAYETITTLAELLVWVAAARAQGYVAFDTETTSLDAMQAELVGVSLALAPGKACYIPLQHKEGQGDMFGGGLADGQMPLAEALGALKPMLEDPAILKIAQNLKYDWQVLNRYNIIVAPFDDTMLLSYALDAGKGGNGMDELSERWLGHTPIPFKEVAGTGKAQVTFDLVPIDKASAYAAEDADVTLRLWLALKPRLAGEQMTTVYETLERPLLPVLGRMEKRGIMVDRQMLQRLSGELAQSAAGIEAEIHDLAGETFNVASPKQIGDILFGKLGLPGGKKTKTGAWSTSASVLDDLAAEGHEMPGKIVAWRQMAKLKSTYTDALPGFINPDSQRVHTSYSLAATTTGRLSSSDPNLQNIPVRTEEGRKIRQAFIPLPGHKLISADYSQIELRVLAHMADIPQLRQAFADGLDIHAMTASEMFGVPIAGMDPLVRRQAKAINFGIIYGISAFGLANQLSISRGEAKDYIDTYFKRFPGIKDYMESTKAFAHANGYVETIFGRKVHYAEINTKNPNMRAFLERAAINAPIQGSAADIIRRAMIRMEDALDQAGVKADMLLQVHDELIFEVEERNVTRALPVITRVMEQAALPVVDLAVPLQVDARAADNWDDAH